MQILEGIGCRACTGRRISFKIYRQGKFNEADRRSVNWIWTVTQCDFKFVLPKFLLALLCLDCSLNYSCFRSFWISPSASSAMEFSGLHYCLFVKVQTHFSMSLLLAALCFPQRQLIKITTALSLCQQLFLFFQKVFCGIVSLSCSENYYIIPPLPTSTLFSFFSKVFLTGSMRLPTP